MDRSLVDAIAATTVFLIATFLLVSGGNIVPTVFGSYFLGGLAALVSGVSLCVALYQWDEYFGVFQAEMHASNARGIGPRLSSIVVSMSSILALTGTLTMVYGLLAAVA